MNILHMKYAVEVARLGSLNKAAETNRLKSNRFYAIIDIVKVGDDYEQAKIF